MNLAVLGSTGMIGARWVAEAARRGHRVTAVTRSGALAEGAPRAIAMELNDTPAVAAMIGSSDAGRRRT